MNQLTYWSRMAPHYDEHFGVAVKERRIEAKAVKMATAVHMGSGKRVLEVGCGTGCYSRHYVMVPGLDLTISDLSPQMLEIAQRKCQAKGFVADVHCLPCESDTYDAVVGSYVLQYLDLGMALPEIGRVLKPGGRVAFLETNTWNPYVLLRTHLAPWAFGVVKGATSFTRAKMVRQLLAAGFGQIMAQPADWMPMCPIPGSYIYSAVKGG